MLKTQVFVIIVQMALCEDEKRSRLLRQIVRNLPEQFSETFRITPKKFSNPADKPWNDEKSFPNKTQRDLWIYATAVDSKFRVFDRPTDKEIKSRLHE